MAFKLAYRAAHEPRPVEAADLRNPGKVPALQGTKPGNDFYTAAIVVVDEPSNKSPHNSFSSKRGKLEQHSQFANKAASKIGTTEPRLPSERHLGDNESGSSTKGLHRLHDKTGECRPTSTSFDDTNYARNASRPHDRPRTARDETAMSQSQIQHAPPGYTIKPSAVSNSELDENARGRNATIDPAGPRDHSKGRARSLSHGLRGWRKKVFGRETTLPPPPVPDMRAKVNGLSQTLDVMKLSSPEQPEPHPETDAGSRSRPGEHPPTTGSGSARASLGSGGNNASSSRKANTHVSGQGPYGGHFYDEEETDRAGDGDNRNKRARTGTLFECPVNRFGLYSCSYRFDNISGIVKHLRTRLHGADLMFFACGHCLWFFPDAYQADNKDSHNHIPSCQRHSCKRIQLPPPGPGSSIPRQCPDTIGCLDTQAKLLEVLCGNLYFYLNAEPMPAGFRGIPEHRYTLRSNVPETNSEPISAYQSHSGPGEHNLPAGSPLPDAFPTVPFTGANSVAPASGPWTQPIASGHSARSSDDCSSRAITPSVSAGPTVEQWTANNEQRLLRGIESFLKEGRSNVASHDYSQTAIEDMAGLLLRLSGLAQGGPDATFIVTVRNAMDLIVPLQSGNHPLDYKKATVALALSNLDNLRKAKHDSAMSMRSASDLSQAHTAPSATY